MSENAKSLALEISSDGISLFRCEGDIPVECLVHLDNEDPDLDAKTRSFLNDAAHVALRQLETAIWLTDDRIMDKRFVLEPGPSETRRDAAASALTASTAYRVEDLSFDIGETGADGYTAVAAVPNATLDEAMAMAKGMMLNPTSVTSTNDLPGFPARPAFARYEVRAAVSRAPARMAMAAAAALVALPFAFAGLGTDGVDLGFGPKDAGIAAVVTTPLPADQIGPQVLPDMTGDRLDFAPMTTDLAMPQPDAAPVADLTETQLVLDHAVPAFLDIPPSMTGNVHSLPGLTFAGALSDPDPLRSRDVPMATRLADAGGAAIGLPTRLAEVIRPTAPQSLPAAEGLMPTAPRRYADAGPMFLPADQPVDWLLSPDSGDTAFLDDQAFELANIPADLPVLRPAPRQETAPRQPGTAVIPRERPGDRAPVVEAVAPQFASLPAIGATENGLSELADGPEFGMPSRPVDVLDPGHERAIGRAVLIGRIQAIDAANAARGLPGDSVVMPRHRSARPIAETGGAVVVFDSPILQPPDIATTLPDPPGPTADPDIQIERGASMLASIAFDALPRRVATAAAPSTPTEDPVSADRIAMLIRQPAPRPISPDPTIQRSPFTVEAPPVRPGQPQLAAPEEPEGNSEALSETQVARLTLPELPPARPGGTPSEEAARAATDSEAVAADPEDETITPDLADVPGLAAPRARPDQLADVVQDILESNDTGPAVLAALSPISRPDTLAARATAIRAQRAASAARVAARQQPASTTPSESLRIPTSARVASTATIENGIALGDLSLIGIMGKSNARRALVRLPQGRVVRVERGTRVSGWTVSAISDELVRLQRGSQSKVLRLPN